MRTASSPTFGTILVDTSGKTLYTFTKNGRNVACSGGCSSVWPPLTVAPGVTPKGSSGVTGLGVSTQNGVRQVTHDGFTLFTYVGDSSPGSTNGEGVSSFGGIWHVAKATGSPGATSASSSGTSTTSGGGYGGGY